MKGGGAGLWTRMAWLFLVRSGRSTAALSVMVVTAVAVLIFLSALTVGVKDAMLRNTVGLFSGHITGYDLPATSTPRDLVVPGVDPDRETAHTALQRKISRGRYPAAGHDEIMISEDTALMLGVQPGNRLLFTPPAGGRSTDLAVSGVYRTGLESLDRGLAFCPADCLDRREAVWSAAVFLRTGVEADAVIRTYRRQLGPSLRFES